MNAADTPIIVVEGLDGTGKSTVCRLLAARLGATLLRTPPSELDDVRPRLDAVFARETAAATLLYAATVALASDQARAIRASGQPVVIDRYWLSTLAYARVLGLTVGLAAVERLLVRPDLTVRLVAPLEVRRQRVTSRGLIAAHDRATLRPDVSARLDAAFDALEAHPLAGRVLRVDAHQLAVNEVADHVLEEIA